MTDESVLKGIRVLIVDDELLIRQTLTEFLQLFGVVVSTADDGNRAFDMIMAYDYNIILSDVRMPECSGVDLLKRIRVEKKEKMPPVLLMSAFTDVSTERAKELGAKGMFLKAEDSNYLKEMLIQITKGLKR